MDDFDLDLGDPRPGGGGIKNVYRLECFSGRKRTADTKT